MAYSYDYYKKSADFLLDKFGDRPEIGIILGSGLGHFAAQVEDAVTVPYTDIPNFLRSTAIGHAGQMIFGKVAGKKVVCMAGRFQRSFRRLRLLPVLIWKAGLFIFRSLKWQRTESWRLPV